jgi:tetratricopeptide (TPR) repeat protein
MSRYFAVPVFALTAMVAACGRSDRTPTTSSSAGASTPVVSGSNRVTDSSGEPRVEVAPVSYERAESTFDAGKYSEAAQLFSAYTESNAENPWGHYMLGMAAWKSGERDRALSAFDRSIELDPTHRKSLYNSSRVLLELGRPQEALDRIEKALGQEPSSSEGLRLLGRARYQLGKADEAIDAYRRALTIDDHDVWAMNNLGLIYIEQDKATEALPPLARAVQLRGNAPVFQNNLGVALERSGFPEAAAQAYEAAIAVDSSYQKASVALARVTSGEQQPETEPVNLAQLAQQFEGQITGWREAGTSGGVTDTLEVSSDSVEMSTVVTDSSTASLEAHSDSLENGEHGE